MPCVLGDRAARSPGVRARRAQAGGHRALGWPGVGVRGGGADAGSGGVRARGPGLRDLLRPPAHGADPRGRGRGDGAARVRTHAAPRDRAGVAAGGPGGRRAGVDEPRRRRDAGPRGVPRDLPNRRDPHRVDGGPRAVPVRGAVPPGGRAHAQGGGRDEAVPLRRVRPPAGLDAGERDRTRGRDHPRPGRAGRGALRALRRRRLGGGGPPRAQGGRGAASPSRSRRRSAGTSECRWCT